MEIHSRLAAGTIRSCQRAALVYSMQHFEELQRAATAAGTGRTACTAIVGKAVLNRVMCNVRLLSLTLRPRRVRAGSVAGRGPARDCRAGIVITETPLPSTYFRRGAATARTPHHHLRETGTCHLYQCHGHVVRECTSTTMHGVAGPCTQQDRIHAASHVVAQQLRQVHGRRTIQSRRDWPGQGWPIRQ